MANVQGYTQLQARLHAIQGAQLSKLLGLATVREAKLLVHRKTGTTGRSIRMTSVTPTSVTVQAGGAAPFLEYGTRPHEITPKVASVLRFAAKGVGVTLAGRVRSGEVRRLGSGAYTFAKRVHHPGTRPYPFLVPGAKRAIGTVGVDAIVSLWNTAA